MANIHSDALSGGAGDVSPTAVSSSPAISKARKRTKTGCLTCRKRRIKCGEERPTCGNCIKSKRQCEGYNQRVIFKPPIGGWPNHPSVVSTIQYHTSMLPGARSQQYRASEELSPTHMMQPRSSIDFDFSRINSPPGEAQGRAGGHDSFRQNSIHQQPYQSPMYQQSFQSSSQQPPLSTSSASYPPEASSAYPSAPPHFIHEMRGTFQEHQTYNQTATYPSVSPAYDSNVETKLRLPSILPHSLQTHHFPLGNQPEATDLYHPQSKMSPQSDQYAPYTDPQPLQQSLNIRTQEPVHSLQLDAVGMSQSGHHNNSYHSSYPSAQILAHESTSNVKYMPQSVLAQPFGSAESDSPTQALDEAAVEKEDDDYWDVQSDDDMLDMELSDDSMLLASSEFSNIRRIHNENFNESEIRRYDSFLYDGLLSHYRPEYAASPLRNPKTAQVFAHYIHVTGPALSIHERNPRNSALIFEGLATHAQQGLWTYILPLKAIAHQGLLHAMLALASLHIARLQGASITPSYKHYAYSLKRLVRSLGDAKKRLSVSTLATSMLLAFYEVWMAEHVKWSTHLIGAQRLITELDFRSLTREARRLKAAQTAQEQQCLYQNPEMLINQTQLDARQDASATMPNERLVGMIVGKSVNYDEFGMVIEANGARQETRSNLSEALNLRNFETLQDLYWSYARHDVFQSIISGNPLINPYRKWSDCPPRAPLGRADALFGSHDHVILLLGRIADFTFQDRERKLRQIDSDGGWRPRSDMPGFDSMGKRQSNQPPTPVTPRDPPPHMQVPPTRWTEPSSSGFGPPPNNPGSPMPNFYGMAPAHPPGPLPPSYENPNYERSPKTPDAPHPRFSDLTAEYEDATHSWNRIAAAHAAVADILASTDSFAPLPDEFYPPVPGENNTSNMTPFGPALMHRSYDISILWTLLHLAKIILLRSHPAMPPAAQMAAGVCAAATQPYAMLIGRITAGMQIPLGENLSPFLGAVLTESTLSLFFAGVQFQEPSQRDWLITRLFEIDRRTGWASAGIIARGCETAWEKAAGMGRGPPYRRRTRRPGQEGPLILEDRVKGNWRHKEKNDYGKGAVVHEGQEHQDDDRNTGRRQADGRDSVIGDDRFIIKGRMLPWAKNLLGTEDELRAGMERFGL